ncbi:Pectinesterase 2 [Sesamum alatum]|uniref:Pectinesterase n=1 Tax=Sesamum alatum TaxID=300844 RepID=A0AAE1YJX6_9LAMI|nr:Pectinesterase 2 [Sesamum alatum]
MPGLPLLLACSCLSLFCLSGLASPSSVYRPNDAVDAYSEPNKFENSNKNDSPDPENLPSITRTKSLNMAVDAAMNRALETLNHITLQDSKSQNVREKAAVSDCWKFYEFTISRLNQTLNPSPKSTSLDVQTWLSAALTNLENCKASITELNVRNSVGLEFLSDNVSELISNSLAINAEIMEKNVNQKSLPSWLPEGYSKNFKLTENTAQLVVAQDGSGNFRTIKQALDAASKRRNSARIVIHIKQGKYYEYLEISSYMKNIMLVGDGIGKTIITGNKSVASGYTTFQSSTVKVMGDGFVARDITFRNTAGAESSQAVALFSSSDFSAFYRCAFEGYQDTLWANSNRQFFEDCHIYGTIDFIFGNAAVVIQNSFIYARKPKRGQSVVITAQGRTDPNQKTGISIINCKVQAGPDLRPVVGQYNVYLGRPWMKYSCTIYLKTFLGSLINPLGWMDWSDHSRENTVYYGEYGNWGPGSSTKGRVKWPGYRVITSATEAKKFSVANFIGGKAWLPETGVPFAAGL